MNKLVCLSLAFVLMASSLVGCVFGCTEIGCDNGLTILFLSPEGDPIEPSAGRLIAGSEVFEFDCAAGGGEGVDCFGEEAFFFITEPTVSLELVNQAGEIVHTHDFAGIDYEVFQPNAFGCGSECNNATVTAVIEAPNP